MPLSPVTPADNQARPAYPPVQLRNRPANMAAKGHERVRKRPQPARPVALGVAPPRPRRERTAPAYPPGPVEAPQPSEATSWQQVRDRSVEVFVQTGVPLMKLAMRQARWAASAGWTQADHAWQHTLEPNLRAACLHSKQRLLPALQQQGRVLVARGVHNVGLAPQAWQQWLGQPAAPVASAEPANPNDRTVHSELPGDDWLLPD